MQLSDLFSDTITTPVGVTVGGAVKTVNVTWAPARYTGEMDELAEAITAEENRDLAEVDALREAGEDDQATTVMQALQRRNMRNLRRLLSELVTSWDLMDGEVEHPHDGAGLLRLPDSFVQLVFLTISGENQPDPQKAASSNGTSVSAVRPARSRRGTRSSEQPITLASRRG